MLLPEAYESQPGLLPHMHGDEEARYPRAVVEHEPGDLEPEENTVLEQRGVALGQRAPRPLARAPAQLPAAQLLEKRHRLVCTSTGRSTACKA